MLYNRLACAAAALLFLIGASPRSYADTAADATATPANGANATPFGLCAGICTTSLRHARHLQRNADVGMVMVNLPTAGVDYHVPFGGRRDSSYGPREQGQAAAEFYTVGKTAYIKSS